MSFRVLKYLTDVTCNKECVDEYVLTSEQGRLVVSIISVVNIFKG